MARYKTYDYRQRVLLPVSLENQLMPGTLEFVHTLVEQRLDMSIFEGKYRNDETGGAAYDPKILSKLVLLPYSGGLISSRKIEQACRENVVIIALACGQLKTLIGTDNMAKPLKRPWNDSARFLTPYSPFSSPYWFCNCVHRSLPPSGRSCCSGPPG